MMTRITLFALRSKKDEIGANQQHMDGLKSSNPNITSTFPPFHSLSFLLNICTFSDQYQQLPALNIINQLQQNLHMPQISKLPKSSQQRQSLLTSLQQQITHLHQLQPNRQTSQRLSILQQRVLLISSVKEYSQPRLGNLQRLLKHYSTNIFRPGVKYDFDQIKYINEHLIVERFLAFIKDFSLNEIMVNGEVKNIVEPKQLALLFKTSSADSRNVDLTEFILLLEKLFVMLFNENQDYTRKQRQLKRERREKRRQAREREIKRLEKIEARLGPQIATKQGANGGVKKAASPNKEKSKPSSLKLKKTELEDSQPTNEVVIDTQTQVLYQITDQQKIESYMMCIGIDDRKEMQKKLRAFSKADYKYYQTQDLQRFKPNKNQEDKPVEVVHKKKEQSKQRLQQVKEKVIKRELAKSKHLLSKSLSKPQHQVKLTMRKNSLNQLTLKPPREEGLHYSLQMLAHSSPGQLPLHKILPNRIISPDPTDHIYMRQFGLTSRNKNDRSHSNAQMIKRTKQLAEQLQTQQANHLSRYTNNVLPNHQYLKKFLQRKW